jgi:hypothetical protein
MILRIKIDYNNYLIIVCLNCINFLVHVFEIQCAFCEQGTEFLNIILTNLMAEWCKVEMNDQIYTWLQILFRL